MKILLSGASGLVGSALMPKLEAAGHSCVQLVRRDPTDSNEIQWDPSAGTLSPAAFDGVDAVINLSGAGIAEGRWTEARKKILVDSRVDCTALLAKTMAGLETKPSHFVSASAIGYYGNRGDESLTEVSSPGEGFMSNICVQWENAAEAAREAGIRTSHIRIGIVLTPDGGALEKMLPPFKMGMGGRVGTGKQMMSWIGMHDILRAIEFVTTHPSVEGAINLTTPHPVANAEFTKTLGEAINRPTAIPAPAFIIKKMFGEMGEALLLGGAKVLPAKLEALGFTFDHPGLPEALAALDL